MAKIVWTIQATYDLKDILDYISKDSRKYAENQIKRIKERTKLLKNNGLAGRIVPEADWKELRELIEGNYRIIYRYSNAEIIEILTIHHAARDFKSRDII